MAAVIEHGRRKGTVKSQDSSFVGGDNNQGQTKQHPSKVALLSINEWNRIQDQLSGVNREKEEAKRRQERKKAKHQQSLATVEHWENTIEGQRLKRLENRKLKALKDEEEKLHIDEEEARFQADEKKMVIERAKRLIYYKTDRIKTFHSSLVLSEVLREREKQIDCKKARQYLLKLQDKEYLRLQEEEREKGMLADIESAKEKTKATKEICLYQLSQSATKDAYKKQQRKFQLDEQAALEAEYEQWKDKELEKEKKLLKEKEELKLELDRLIVDTKEREEMERERERIEDEERRIFAEAKKNMMKLRKTKEAEIIQEIRNHQEKMKKQLHSIQQTKTSNEDERIAIAVAEQEETKLQNEKEKHEKYIQSMKDMYAHRIKMMSDHSQQERDKAALEQELLRQRVTQDEKFHAAEFEKFKKASTEAKEVQKFHQAQLAEKYKRDEMEQLEEHDDWQTNMDMLKIEENQFQEYAQQVISEANERKAPIYPIQAASKSGAGGGRGNVFSGKGGIRPSYQATDSHGIELPSYAVDSSKLPLSWRIKNTKKRMGFTW